MSRLENVLFFAFCFLLPIFAIYAQNSDTYFYIRNPRNGYVLYAQEQYVNATEPDDSDSQQWRVQLATDGNCGLAIVNKKTGKALAGKGGTKAGTNVITPVNNGVNQRWFLIPDDFDNVAIVSVAKPQFAVNLEGTIVSIQERNATTHQSFHFIKVYGGNC